MAHTTDPKLEAFLDDARRDPEAMFIAVLEALAANRRELNALAETNHAQAAAIVALCDLVTLHEGGAA